MTYNTPTRTPPPSQGSGVFGLLLLAALVLSPTLRKGLVRIAVFAILAGGVWVLAANLFSREDVVGAGMVILFLGGLALVWTAIASALAWLLSVVVSDVKEDYFTDDTDHDDDPADDEPETYQSLPPPRRHHISRRH